MADLNPERARIFRITHVDNLPWVLDHGLCCRNSDGHDPNYVNIGNLSLIDKRAHKPVPIPPGGTLADYVPFYFTPYSIMMYNIKTGYGGIARRETREIVILVSSIHLLRELGVPFVFTNQHAYASDADFYSDPADLRHIDWPLLRSRNFKTDDGDPGKQVRYQAEVLVYRRVSLEALLGIGCLNTAVKQRLDALVQERGKKIDVKVTPSWYF